MATLNPQQDPNNPQQMNQPATGGAGGAASAAPGAGVSQITSPVQQNVAPQASQGYTDVSSYLNANQPGSSNIGNQVAQNLTNTYKATKGTIDTSAQAAAQAANTGYTPENQNLIAQVEANPMVVASNPDQTSAFQAQLNDVYGGPTSWADLGNLQGQVAQTQQTGNLVNTPGGANILTQNVEQQLEPGHTSQGINALDTLLLTGNPNAMAAVQTASAPYANLGDYLNAQNTGVTQAIGAGQQAASQTAADALAAGTGAVNTLNTNINQTAQDRLAAEKAQATVLATDIKNLYGDQTLDTNTYNIGTYGGGQTPWFSSKPYAVGQLSPEDLTALGINADQWTALQTAMQETGTGGSQQSTFAGSPHHFNAPIPTTQIDINQWLNQLPGTTIAPGTVATPEQYQEMAALNQLLGTKAPIQNEAINPALASLAGTAPTNLNQFYYQTALQSAQNTAAQEKQAAIDEANAIETNANSLHAAGQHHGGVFGSIGNFLSSNLPILNPPLAIAQKTLQKVK